MSTAERSIGGCRSAIQSARTQPTPPADWSPTELKPAATKQPSTSGAIAEVIHAVRGEGLRAVEEELQAAVTQRWNTVDGTFEDRARRDPSPPARVPKEKSRGIPSSFQTLPRGSKKPAMILPVSSLKYV